MVLGRIIEQVNYSVAYLYIRTLLLGKVKIPGFMQLLENLVFMEFPNFLIHSLLQTEATKEQHVMLFYHK